MVSMTVFVPCQPPNRSQGIRLRLVLFSSSLDTLTRVLTHPCLFAKKHNRNVTQGPFSRSVSKLLATSAKRGRSHHWALSPASIAHWEPLPKSPDLRIVFRVLRDDSPPRMGLLYVSHAQRVSERAAESKAEPLATCATLGDTRICNDKPSACLVRLAASRVKEAEE